MTQLFNIFKVDELEAKRLSAFPEKPHHHDYEELIIGIEGQLEHFIDFKNTVFEAPFICFVTKGKVHRIIPKSKNGKCNMWVIRFQSEFIPDITFQLYANYHNDSMIKLSNDYCFERLISICQIIVSETERDNPDLSVISHLLSALFFMIESERSKKIDISKTSLTSQNTTLHQFLKILEENYKKPVGVEYYAEKLFMSTRNLNIICKNILQKTVSEIIETRKLTEGKKQLVYTDKNISEIGFDLGYNEKAYFTNVFKKRTGMTPSEFRVNMKKLLS